VTTTDPYAGLREPLTGQPPLNDATFPPGHPDAAPRREAAPPGMVWMLMPDGQARLGYLPPGYEKAAGDPASSAAAERDKWPGRMLAGGAGTSMVLGVIGHYGPGLSQAGHGAEMAGIGLGIATAGIGALFTIVKGSVGSKRAPVEVTLNLTNNVSSSSRSHSRSNNRGR
jgi:hypothetical protein